MLRATCLLIPVPVLDPFSVGAERIGQLNMKEGINGYHFLGERKGVCGLRQNHTCNGEHGEQHEKSPEVDIFQGCQGCSVQKSVEFTGKRPVRPFLLLEAQGEFQQLRSDTSTLDTRCLRQALEEAYRIFYDEANRGKKHVGLLDQQHLETSTG